MGMDELSYRIRRNEHPTISIFWIAESVARGAPVILYEINCMFCRRPVLSDFKGEILHVINSPINLKEFGAALTIRCKLCKQRYRLITANSFMG